MAAVGRPEVVILPDADEAGRRYAHDVAALLATVNPPARARIVELPELPNSGDVYDFIGTRREAGVDDAAIRAEIEAMANAAEHIEPDKPEPAVPPVEPWRPFPVDLLPEPVSAFVRETAAAMCCDSANVAMPVLAGLAAAIGTTRAIQLKPSWSEYPIIWTALIVRSGSIKSPAMEAALEPLHRVQIEALAEHREAVRVYEAIVAASKGQRGKAGAASGETPERPQARRHVVSDITSEALAPILDANPRGVLVARDELSGWVRGFNQYKGGRGGDAEAWLELHRGGTLIVDRKGSGTIHVRRAAVSVCGTIQPGVAARVFGSEYMESGLVARLLVARPPEKVKRWSDRTPSQAVLRGYETVIGDLLALQHVEGEYGPEPVRLPMTGEARLRWVPWYDRHAQRIASADTDHEAAALAKLEAYGARFSLIFALVDNPSATEISADAIARGLRLADWFAHDSRRTYTILRESDEARQHRHLVELIGRKGGVVTARDLMRSSPRTFPTAEDAEAALHELVKGGLGAWEQDDHDGGRGRPVRRFRLVDANDTDTNRTNPQKNGNCVNVNSVNAPADDAPDPDPAGDTDDAHAPPDGDDGWVEL